MSLQKWSKTLAEILGPDVQAWKNLAPGGQKASLGDFAGAGLDLVGFVPGGVSLKAGFKGARAASRAVDGTRRSAFKEAAGASATKDTNAILSKVPGDVGDQAKWRQNPLWSGADDHRLAKGDRILPADAVGKTPKTAGSTMSGTNIRNPKKTVVDERGHEQVAWAANDRTLARSYANEHRLPGSTARKEGLEGALYRVIPVKPKKTFLRDDVSGGRPTESLAGKEVWGPEFKIVGRDRAHDVAPTKAPLPWPVDAAKQRARRGEATVPTTKAPIHPVKGKADSLEESREWVAAAEKRTRDIIARMKAQPKEQAPFERISRALEGKRLSAQQEIEDALRAADDADFLTKLQKTDPAEFARRIELSKFEIPDF